ncbi:hypothetical protein [Megasphaera massiliensis]|uniref:hypothetical protein n=1 Tax=Megasphaera massiliensis TaxID=1232428 RepID=UPI002A75C4BB|nr:hypothetical protein [Megasphaera massiliensis]
MPTAVEAAAPENLDVESLDWKIPPLALFPMTTAWALLELRPITVAVLLPKLLLPTTVLAVSPMLL